jgi:hypothetical protein
MVTKAHLLEQAAAFKAKIDSGKLSGVALKKARTAYYNYKRRAGDKSGGSTKSTKSVAKKTSQPKAKSKVLGQNNQGILHGILAELNPVHIEELIADRIFKTVSAGQPLADVVKSITEEVTKLVTAQVLEIEQKRISEQKEQQKAELAAKAKAMAEARIQEARRVMEEAKKVLGEQPEQSEQKVS